MTFGLCRHHGLVGAGGGENLPEKELMVVNRASSVHTLTVSTRTGTLLQKLVQLLIVALHLLRLQRSAVE